MRTLSPVPAELEAQVTPDGLRRCCLGKPGALEDFPFGEQVSVFKVAGKLFAIAELNGVPLEVSLKCDPDLAEALRSEHPAIRPGYHLNKRHWNTVTLDGSIADGEIEDMIQDSYDLVAAKLTRARRDELRPTSPPSKRTRRSNARER
jgi:predicted DNA-binding protein (MmcQ/YjbR family)